MKFKRFLSISLIAALTCTCSLPAFASGKNADNVESEKICITTTQEERDAIFEEAMKEVLAKTEQESTVTRGPQYHYKTEYLPYRYTTLRGFAGNQVAGGYRFPSGGGFWFTDSGGPVVSTSVNIGLPSPYSFVTVSANLGQKGSSGLWVSAPASNNYYKLYVSKTMEVRPYATYRAPVGTENWQLYNSGAVSVVYQVIPEARVV